MTEQTLLELETPEIKTTKMSYEDYLALPDEGPLVEWVNEEVIYHMTAKPIHQEIVSFLDQLLGIFVRFFGLGKILLAPIEVKCFPGGNSREPDILFVTSENLSRIDENRINGPPDLIIEIVSNDSVARDYDDKFVEYEECGVPEYWIVDPRPKRQRARFYQLGEGGLYEPVLPKEGVYHSKVIPGFWFKVAWLWERPDPLTTFAEIVGLSAEVFQNLRPHPPQ